MKMSWQAVDLLGGQRWKETTDDEAFAAYLRHSEHHEAVERLGERCEAIYW